MIKTTAERLGETLEKARKQLDQAVRNLRQVSGVLRVHKSPSEATLNGIIEAVNSNRTEILLLALELVQQAEPDPTSGPAKPVEKGECDLTKLDKNDGKSK